jgi:subtilisin family serine protease
MPVKVLKPAAGGGTEGDYSWWADGVDWAVANGAKVINLSAGGTLPSLTLEHSISNAVNSGVIFVTITHNQGGSEPIRFPGRLPYTIAVGASDTTNSRCLFSNYGPELDLLAPGTNIHTVTMGGDWVEKWGTSFAAPQVAGVAALLCAIRPDLDNEQARALLCGGAEDRVGGAEDVEGFDEYYGWGRLNAYNSLVLAQSTIDSFVVTNDTSIAMSWECPPNASNKEPYVAEYCSALTGAWTRASNISCTASRAVWVDDGATNAAIRFYRVNVREF